MPNTRAVAQEVRGAQSGRGQAAIAAAGYRRMLPYRITMSQPDIVGGPYASKTLLPQSRFSGIAIADVATVFTSGETVRKSNTE